MKPQKTIKAKRKAQSKEQREMYQKTGKLMYYQSYGNVPANGLNFGNVMTIQLASAFLLGTTDYGEFNKRIRMLWEEAEDKMKAKYIPWELMNMTFQVGAYQKDTQEYKIPSHIVSACAVLGFSAKEILDQLLELTYNETGLPVVTQRILEEEEEEDWSDDILYAPLNAICYAIALVRHKRAKNDSRVSMAERSQETSNQRKQKNLSRSGKKTKPSRKKSS